MTKARLAKNQPVYLVHMVQIGEQADVMTPYKSF